jgi:hypothetical protein
MTPKPEGVFNPMKTKLLVFLFLSSSIIPNLLFAQFTQQGPKLVGTGAIGNAWQGSSVAISSDGNTAIVGGYLDISFAGAIWVFTRSTGVWTQQGTKLFGTGAVGNSEQGHSVAISSDGNTAIIGGPRDNNDIGAVWVFNRSAGVWIQQGTKLVGTGAVGNSEQGFSVAISSDGNTAIVGGILDNSNAGAVWIFTRSGSVWTQQGQKLFGTGAVGSQVFQGSSVAISSDGNTSIVGGDFDNSSRGAIWIFTRSGGVWTQQGSKLVGTGAVGSAVYQGKSVAISSDGNTVVEGGYVDNLGAGAMWVFIRNVGVWTQQGSKLVGTGAVGNAEQGYSVAISSDGNTAIVGGGNDNNYVGAIWVFTRSGGVWTQLGPKLVGTGAVGIADQGSSVAISSDGTVIEGGYEDNNNTGAGWVFYNPTIGITPVSGEIPKEFSLLQNYPNPFNPSTKIRFEVPGYVLNKGLQPLVQLRVYDILGREISTLINQELQPGTYEINFDGTDFPGGIYFYKLLAGDFTETKKMILIK